MNLIRRFTVDGFRNLNGVDLEFNDRLNILLGPNGSGKTALLEALHYGIRGRSFRTSHSAELIGHDSSGFLLRLDVEDASGVVHRGGIQRLRQKKQVVHWDGDRTSGFAQVSGLLPLQVILPTTSELVFGTPALRRRWLDWGVFHVEHAYLTRWRQYMRLLQQRNATLKQLSLDRQSNPALVSVYTHQMLELSIR